MHDVWRLWPSRAILIAQAKHESVLLLLWVKGTILNGSQNGGCRCVTTKDKKV